MACSLSFPRDRAAIVGYLKAVLATAAGMWATLWTHVFAPLAARGGPGLLSFLGLMAASTLLASVVASRHVGVLPVGPSRRELGRADKRRLGGAISLAVALALTTVCISFFYSKGTLPPTPAAGVATAALALLPLGLLPCAQRSARVVHAKGEPSGLGEALLPARASSGNGAADAPFPAERPLPAPSGLTFGAAAAGLDFWLLWGLQFAIFGSGVATNQNLALILESAEAPAARCVARAQWVGDNRVPSQPRPHPRRPSIPTARY